MLNLGHIVLLIKGVFVHGNFGRPIRILRPNLESVAKNAIGIVGESAY